MKATIPIPTTALLTNPLLRFWLPPCVRDVPWYAADRYVASAWLGAKGSRRIRHLQHKKNPAQLQHNTMPIQGISNSHVYTP
jgi:hypothetical protein